MTGRRPVRNIEFYVAKIANHLHPTIHVRVVRLSDEKKMKSLVWLILLLISLQTIKAGLHERRLLNDLFMYYDAR